MLTLIDRHPSPPRNGISGARWRPTKFEWLWGCLSRRLQPYFAWRELLWVAFSEIRVQLRPEFLTSLRISYCIDNGFDGALCRNLGTKRIV